jgi:hypothetical protein
MLPPALIGAYTPPAWTTGRRVYCNVRKAWCRVTSYHGGPIPWPRGRADGGSSSGLIVTPLLELAIRTESAAALGYWLGVDPATVWKWRKAFGVTRAGTKGSRRALRSRRRAGRTANA